MKMIRLTSLLQCRNNEDWKEVIVNASTITSMHKEVFDPEIPNGTSDDHLVRGTKVILKCGSVWIVREGMEDILKMIEAEKPRNHYKEIAGIELKI